MLLCGHCKGCRWHEVVSVITHSGPKRGTPLIDPKLLINKKLSSQQH